MSVLEQAAQIIKDSGHEYCSADYIGERLADPVSGGLFNVHAFNQAKQRGVIMPIRCMTGYISTKMVKDEYKLKVADELIQDHYDIAFADGELADSTSGFAYVYCVR